MKLREENEFAKKSAILVGNVSNTLALTDLPIVVAAYSNEDSKRTIVHYTTLHEPGPYELMVPVGTHNIVAFGDRNKNLSYDKGEPAGQILNAGTGLCSCGRCDRKSGYCNCRTKQQENRSTAWVHNPSQKIHKIP